MKRILITLLLLLPIFSFGQVNLKNGLVSCYPFNANANDESGSNNNGTVTGATLTTDRFGNTNSAYSFNGTSDFIEISPSKLQTTEFSYSLWVKPSSIPDEGIAYFLFSVGSEEGDQDLSLNKGYTNGTDGFTGGGYVDVGQNSFCQKGTSPNVNQWYHLVFVREANVYKVYLDGSLMCSTPTVSKPPFYGTGVVKAIIGGRNNKSQFAHAVLDDINLYNRAVTPEEVTALYQTTKSQTVDLKNGLVACYPFNGNATDATGNGNDGTINGATLATDRFGKANSAYSFDGSSHITVNPDQFKNENYSFSLWVKLDNLPPDGDQSCFISVGAPGGDHVVSVASSYSSLFTRGFSVGSSNIGTPAGSSNWTGSPPDLLRWYHLVYTRDKTSIKLFVDGIQIANLGPNTLTNGTSSNYQTPTNFIIGSRVGANGFIQYTSGILDDIYIYNRAITPEEVTALYQTTKSQTVDLKNGLVACYPFNGNAQDETKNGHNGTVNGATLTTDRFGKTNSAYSFNGNSFIQLANPNDFKNNSFTYSTWVNIPVEPSSTSYLDAYSVLSIGNGQVMHFVNRPTEGLVWGFTTYNDENISYDINPSSTATTTLNTWHHFVITRSTTQAKIYVDGVLIVTATSTLPSTATYVSSNPAVVYQATIGTRPDENNIQFFNGKIDDVYIYNRPINDAEVTALYQNSKSTPCEDGVIACHPFSVVKTR
jgi:Concanavalin A-like lectin/glucanases superfamily